MGPLPGQACEFAGALLQLGLGLVVAAQDFCAGASGLQVSALAGEVAQHGLGVGLDAAQQGADAALVLCVLLLGLQGQALCALAFLARLAGLLCLDVALGSVVQALHQGVHLGQVAAGAFAGAFAFAEGFAGLGQFALFDALLPLGQAAQLLLGGRGCCCTALLGQGAQGLKGQGDLRGDDDAGDGAQPAKCCTSDFKSPLKPTCRRCHSSLQKSENFLSRSKNSASALTTP